MRIDRELYSNWRMANVELIECKINRGRFRFEVCLVINFKSDLPVGVGPL